MYRNGQLTVSATDLVGFLQCEHLTELSLAAAGGAMVTPSRDDAELGVLSRRGLEDEDAHLDRLRRDGADVAEIPADGEIGLPVTQTLDAMRASFQAAAEAGASPAAKAMCCSGRSAVGRRAVKRGGMLHA